MGRNPRVHREPARGGDRRGLTGWAGRTPPVLVLALALAAPLLSLVPAWRAAQDASPPERVFLGFPYMAGDHYQYAALMRQAQDGSGLLMENPYTTEPQKGVYVFLYHWAVGFVSRLTGLSLPGAWRAAGVFGSFLCVVLFHSLAGRYLEKPRDRLFAVALLALGGGFGSLAGAMLEWRGFQGTALDYPFDYPWNWSTFGTMLVPVWIWALLIFMASCCLLLARGATATAGRAAALFCLMPVLWWTHHHTAMVAYMTIGLLPLMPALVAGMRLQAVPWTAMRRNLLLALPGLGSFGIVLGYLMLARSDEVFRRNAAASFDWKVHYSVWWYPMTYGLLLPLAWFGVKRLSSRDGAARDLLLSWLAAAFVLSVNPIVGGAKYQYLVYPPLVMLGALGARHLLEAASAARHAAGFRIVAALVLLGLFHDAPAILARAMPSGSADREAYAPAGLLDALRWLDGQPAGTVLCSYRTGQIVPWIAGKKVYTGHWFMTLDSGVKSREVRAFFNPNAPEAHRRELLNKSGARYIVHGPNEAVPGAGSSLPFERIYEKDGVSIYRVDPAP